MRPSRLSKPRPGFSLVEIVLVVGAVALLLGLCSGLIHVVLRVDRVARAHLVESRTVGRLARQFRRDVRSAIDAKPSAADGREGSLMELSLPGDRTVAYQAGDRAVVRLQRHGDAVERRETYALPTCTRAGLSLREEGGKTWPVLGLTFGAEPVPQDLRQELRIEGALGRDRRLSPAGREETSR